MNQNLDPNYPNHTDYTDRSTRLLIFGILSVLGGVVCLLLVPLMVMAMRFAPQEMHSSSMWMGAGFYGVAGAVCIGLGIGSIRCRRWARDIILACSYFWLAIGIPSFIFSFYAVIKTMGPSMAQAGIAMPAMFTSMMIVFTGVLYLVLFIVLPLVLVLCYRGNDVLQTCQVKSGSEGWTSHLSIPQLACCLICSMMFLNMLLLPVVMPAVMVWDMILTGTPAIAVMIFFAGLMGYAAWGLYYKTAAGWWIGLVSIIFIMLNYGIAFYMGDFMEFYRVLDFPEEQIKIIQDSGMIEMMKHMWISLLASVVIISVFFWKARPGIGVADLKLSSDPSSVSNSDTDKD